MMTESKRFVTEGRFQEFCQILESRDGRQGGEDLHPSKLCMCLQIHKFYPEFQTVPVSGSAVEIEGASSGDVNLDHPDTNGFDQWGSRLLLKDLRQAKTDFPNVVKFDRYRQILDRAEGIWSGLAKEELVWV